MICHLLLSWRSKRCNYIHGPVAPTRAIRSDAPNQWSNDNYLDRHVNMLVWPIYGRSLHMPITDISLKFLFGKAQLLAVLGLFVLHRCQCVPTPLQQKRTRNGWVVVVWVYDKAATHHLQTVPLLCAIESHYGELTNLRQHANIVSKAELHPKRSAISHSTTCKLAKNSCKQVQCSKVPASSVMSFVANVT